MQKIAAIDIGSNAIRMIVGSITDSQEVQLVENIRLPLRLGQDVFQRGKLQEATIQQAVGAFQQFRQVTDELEVKRIRAIATSAMREASNGHMLVHRVAQATGISIEVIGGTEEAQLIHRAVCDVIRLNDKRAMLIDIGGGSVEVTLSENGSILSTHSHPLGAVRLLQKFERSRDPFSLFGRSSRRPMARMIREYAEPAQKKIRAEIGTKKVDLCIATGGNVEEIGKLRQKLLKQASAALIELDELQALIDQINSLTITERMEKLKLRPDRADVILPAAIVLHLIAGESGTKQILIPNVGLKDGLLAEMADEEISAQRNKKEKRK